MFHRNKIIAIHQPNYFPWLGFFYKIYACDVFVFHDNVEHSKRYPTRRTHIRKAPDSDEACWLTVPLKIHSDFTLIKELEIDHCQDWQGKHLRKISNSYFRAPYYCEVFPLVETWLMGSNQINSLADLNVYLTKNILDEIGIKKEIRRSSELSLDGKGSDYNIAIVKHLGGSTYLSGKGGNNYQTYSTFENGQISLTAIDLLKCLEKDFQLNPSSTKIISSYSILEAMFHIGFEGIHSLLNRVGTQVNQPISS